MVNQKVTGTGFMETALGCQELQGYPFFHDPGLFGNNFRSVTSSMKTLSAAALCLALMIVTARSQDAATPASSDQTLSTTIPPYSVSWLD